MILVKKMNSSHGKITIDNSSFYEDSSAFVENCEETDLSSFKTPTKEETTPRTFMNTFLNVKDTALVALDELEDNSKIEICIYEPLFTKE